MRPARGLFLLSILAACGGAGPNAPQDPVTIDTYLATPVPGSASRAAAARLCRARGRASVVFVETQAGGRGGFRHVYDCR